MNKLSIIPIDKTIYIDSQAKFNFDLTFIPPDVHALQWENDKGWIERKGKHDEILLELPSWAKKCIDMWNDKNK